MNGESSYNRFLLGDESGFVELVRDYKDGLIFYLDSFVKNISAAEELTEDTFVKLGIKKPHFSGKSSFKTWLYAIGRNTALDYIRKHKNDATMSIEECAEPVSDAVLETAYFEKERSMIIRRMMGRLKSEYRQVLWLSYFDELSNKEIALIMKKSVHSVETLAYRARLALKTELEKEGFNGENI